MVPKVSQMLPLVADLHAAKGLGIDTRDDVLRYSGTLRMYSPPRTVVPPYSCTLHG
jgi:hypothetical protein